MSTYLILGGTGKTGRRVARKLGQDGHDVRIAARTPGSGVIPFDWDDPRTHDPALDGADGVWLVPPALRLDHAAQVGEFSARARAAGVARVVVLSARGADLDASSPLAQMEAAVAASGVPHTVLRPTWFMQNFTESFFVEGIVEQGVLAAPTEDGAMPFIDVEDIAQVAAAVLLRSEPGSGAYDLSGPRALTFADAAAILSRHAGRHVRHVDPGLDAWMARAIGEGLPPDYAALLGRLFGFIRDKQDAHLSDGVQRVLGREPTSFADWAAREATALRPAVGHAA